MTNNDIIRRIRYIFNYNDSKMIELFQLAGYEVSLNQVKNWLKKDNDPEYQNIPDKQLALFLNGFITENRGKRERTQPIPEKRLDNNIIFRKLRIALNLKDHEILDILKLVDFEISKHELSAFFRKPTQSQYRLCKDQVLRNFLYGMEKKYHHNKP